MDMARRVHEFDRYRMVPPVSVGADNRTGRRLGAQVGEDGEHAAVRVGRRRKMEFWKMPSMLLHGALGDDDTPGDGEVGEALGREPEDPLFARSQLRERVVSPLTADQQGHHRRVERRSAAGDAAYGCGELGQSLIRSLSRYPGCSLGIVLEELGA